MVTLLYVVINPLLFSLFLNSYRIIIFIWNLDKIINRLIERKFTANFYSSLFSYILILMSEC